MFADVNPSNNGRQQLQKAVIAHAILRPTWLPYTAAAETAQKSHRAS